MAIRASRIKGTMAGWRKRCWHLKSTQRISCGLGVRELLSACRKAGCRDFTDITYALVPTHGLAGAREYYMRVCILSIIYICKHLKLKQSSCSTHSSHFLDAWLQWQHTCAVRETIPHSMHRKCYAEYMTIILLCGRSIHVFTRKVPCEGMVLVEGMEVESSSN